MLTASDLQEKLPSDYKLLYLTHFGAKLYGTDSELSDTDLKGVFIPSTRSVLVKNDIDYFDFGTGEKNRKNTKDDIDCKFWSIHKFLNLLKDGDTAALDIAFSMFRSETIVYADKEFVDIIKFHLPSLLSKNLKALAVYCTKQTAQYGVKGSRFSDLTVLNNAIEKYLSSISDLNGLVFGDFTSSIEFLSMEELKYVKIINIKDREYLSVLDKKYQTNVPIELVCASIKKQYNSYGARTQQASNGEDCIDWKGLSHAVRAIFQSQELLETRHIVFPLTNADFIKSIKFGEKNKEEIFAILEAQMKITYDLVSNSDLPDTIDQEFVNDVIVQLFNVCNS